MVSVRQRLLAMSVSATTLMLLGTGPAAAAPKVVTTIPPIHSLVAGVMAGVGEPSLLLSGGASPHSYTMRPSEARALSEADLVFWVGESLETFLKDPVESLGADATIIELAEAPGLTLLPIREGGVFDEHDHDDHAAEADDDHDHDHAEADDDHGHEHAEETARADDHGHEHAEETAHADDHGHEHAEETAHADDHGHEHEHGAFDGHVWLSIENAERIVDTAAAALSAHDAANAAVYAANAEAMHDKLHALEETLAGLLAPVHERPYIVFHDAYQYMEQEHDLSIAGSISVDPEQRPGARRLAELRDRVQELEAVCIFSEPQFPSDLVETIADGTDAKTGVLDPLGATLTPGPDLYFELMEGMAASLNACLAETS